MDGIKAAIAQMVANSSFEVRPTAIYANPVLLDLIDRLFASARPRSWHQHFVDSAEPREDIGQRGLPK
ncbi:MAG: hypothetical protein M3O09_05415 [Acidobacteriota bacterium]|nr:hypothetical protein [Acidobacteriota bacterium]